MKKKEEPIWCKMYRDEVLKPQQKKRMSEQLGRTEASRAGFYNTKEWKSIRDRRRRENPLCQECEMRGIRKPMYVVDHIIPVEEMPELALDYTNTQSLCSFCHQLKTNRDKQEKRKRERLKQGKKIMKDLEKKFKAGG